MEDVLILGIESSCDETAAAVVKNGKEVLSNVISSQVALHAEFGGVVPEIASRNHLEKIDEVIRLAMEEAGKSFSDLTAGGGSREGTHRRERCGRIPGRRRRY